MLLQVVVKIFDFQMMTQLLLSLLRIHVHIQDLAFLDLCIRISWILNVSRSVLLLWEHNKVSHQYLKNDKYDLAKLGNVTMYNI